jgi:two-component system, NarL family, response regulator DevR
VVTRPRVLLADDHPGVAKALTRLLSFECDVVAVVSDGTEVATAAARLQPVVVVVDVNLPNVNGLEVCREITSNESLARVIVMSGMLDDDIADQARSAGASEFFDKTAMGDALILAIKEAWNGITRV